MKIVSYLASTLIVCSSALGLLTSGCVGEVDDPAEEAVGEAESALSFTGCNTETGGPVDSTSWGYGVSGPVSSSNLPYGSSTCDGFNVNYANTVPILPFSDRCSVYASWDEALPSTQGICLSASVAVKTYDASGTEIASNSQNGSWIGGVCLLPGLGLAPVAALVSSGTHSTALAQKHACTPFCGNDRARVKTQVRCGTATWPWP